MEVSRRAGVEVRALGPSDLSTMRAMLTLFGQVFAEPVTYIANQPTDEYLIKLLASDAFIAIAAIDDSKVVGGLAGYVLPKFEQARSEVYLYDLAVSEGHRRVGIATAMIEHLRSISAARGAWGIFVQADYDDDAAIRLYAKLGKRQHVLHFDIEPSKDDA